MTSNADQIALRVIFFVLTTFVLSVNDEVFFTVGIFTSSQKGIAIKLSMAQIPNGTIWQFNESESLISFISGSPSLR